MNPQENLAAKKLDFSEVDQFFKTIGDVSAEIGIPPHVLRFWESKFLSIKPHKRKGGHRYYNKADVEAIYQIKKLLYEEGYTIKGAQRFLKEKGFMQENTEGQQKLFAEEIQLPLMAQLSPQAVEVQQVTTTATTDVDAMRMLLQELQLIKQSLEK